ncbi:MAG: right-handed parallel beta-helix repeat-containing protein [Bdellovibrionales bacterium]|nr:right-handed parallel beta-helix repeat-containing protein [Bdellovibrionales bacterium]
MGAVTKFVAIFLLISAVSLATDYYLSPTGSDSNAGSRAKPWASLQQAIWRIRAGDTLVVRGGRYTDSSFADLRVPSSGKLTTIRAEENETPVFDGRLSKDKAVHEWQRISENLWSAKLHPKWKRIDGLWIEGKYVKRVKTLAELAKNTWWIDKEKSQAVLYIAGGHSPVGMAMEFRLHSMMEVDTPFWRIGGITAQYYNYAGFVISSTHDVTIIDCNSNHNGGAGIEGDEASRVQILGNETAYNGAEGGPGWASGIHLWRLGSSENLIKGNRAYRNWDPSEHHTDGNGIAIDKGQPGSGAEVSHNTSFENGGRGIDINLSPNVRAHHNVLYDNARDPHVQEFGELCVSGTISSKGLSLYENTIRAREGVQPIVFYK